MNLRYVQEIPVVMKTLKTLVMLLEKVIYTSYYDG